MAVKPPREAGRFIAACSQHVSIQEEGVRDTARMIFPELQNSLYSVKTWKEHKLHPKDLNEATVNWIFVLDTLNFSFWVDEEMEPFVVQYYGERYTGYWALCAVINRALEEGILITTPSYYCGITEKELQHIFRSETTSSIPLLTERVKNLNETGQVLLNHYGNSFANLVKECNKSAAVLLGKITTLFPCFRDEASFQGEMVAFYKRAQILIADLWGCFEGESYGEFKDIDSLTMFADYMVPRGLQFLNVLRYSEKLQQIIETGKLLPQGSLHEVEIRGCSIWAVELICEELHKMFKEQNSDGLQENGVTINAVLVDFYLWDYSKRHEKELIRNLMHKTRSIFY